MTKFFQFIFLVISAGVGLVYDYLMVLDYWGQVADPAIVFMYDMYILVPVILVFFGISLAILLSNHRLLKEDLVVLPAPGEMRTAKFLYRLAWLVLILLAVPLVFLGILDVVEEIDYLGLR